MASSCLQKISGGDDRIPECLGNSFLSPARSQVKDHSRASSSIVTVFAREQIPPEHFDVRRPAEHTRRRVISKSHRVKKQLSASGPRKTPQVAESKLNQSPY
jgi:hypothetical protein